MALQREQVVQTAEKYVSRGKIEPAIREYRKLLADNPNDINTLNRIGDLYARIQRIDEAVDFFTQIAEQYSVEGFFVKAIAIYKKIIKLNPTRLEVYEKLAELYHKQGLVNEARTQYQVLADYYQKHDNAASAIAIYQKMAEVEPDNPTYHVKLAEIYQRQLLTEKAMGEYRIIAEMMIAHGRAQDAAQVYERALDIDSSNVDFISDAVFKLKEAGNVAAAARFLSVASDRNPQAARVARLARVDEPEVEAEPEVPEVVAEPEPPPPAVRTEKGRKPRLVPPPPPIDEEEPEEPEEPRETTLTGWEDDLASTMRAAAAEVAEPKPAPAPHSQTGEFELDLDEVFSLDIDEEEEPASLVKPPPDMIGKGRLGSAWSEEEPAPPMPVAAPAETEALLPPFVPEQEGLPKAPDLEVELEPVGLEGSAFDAFESVQLPRLDASGEILLELEEPALPQLDSASWTLETGPEPLPAEVEIDTDLLDRTAAELQPRPGERDEDLVSEAAVLAKYGLEEKALERLREALRLKPHNLAAYAQMIQIHLEHGRHERVIELANAMAQTAREARDTQAWPQLRLSLVEAGYRIDGDFVVAGPQGEVAAVPETAPPAPAALAEPEAEPAPEPEALEILDLPEPELEPLEVLEIPEAELPPALPEWVDAELPQLPPIAAAPAPEVPVAPAAKARKPLSDVEKMILGMLDKKPKPKRPSAPRSAAPPPAVAPAASTAAPPPAPAAHAAPPTPPPAGPMIFNPLEIGEMIERESEDFTWEPGEAERSQPPPDLLSHAAAGGLSLPPSLDDTGTGSWLDEADRSREAKSPGSEDLFDEEDDFFDLAGQLEHELSQEDIFQSGDGLLVQPAEQSLEEIVEGFKKGVAEHLSPTDYDTHFNLGIAYREMGLLDEAIGEFQIAAKDSGHLVLCCSMLGLCFLDKGLPELAIKWYRRGLEVPGLNEEDHLGLLYDLGCTYLVIGDQPSAYNAFVEIYGINTNYRDVVARIEELGR